MENKIGKRKLSDSLDDFFRNIDQRDKYLTARELFENLVACAKDSPESIRPQYAVVVELLKGLIPHADLIQDLLEVTDITISTEY